MRLIKSIVAMAMALAAWVGHAGESAEFRLDTMDGTRTARAVEKIAYSTAWNGGGAVSVAVDGVTLKEANAPASGDVAWNAAQATPGAHTLTHTCGGETLTAVFEVSKGIVVHFNANGGVFKGKDGDVTQYDQYFTYGEPLFTDDLTPVKSDEYGVHEFLGWVRGTPELTSSDSLIAARATMTLEDDVSEVTLYAVWTTTVTVHFYNQADKTLSPSSLADHLTWKIDDGSSGGLKTRKSGESIEVCPGYRTVMFHVDDGYSWIAGRFNPGDFYSYNEEQKSMKIYIGNDFADPFSSASQTIYVEVQPSSDTDYVRFECAHEIRASLRDRIKESDVPFDASKVRITIGRAAYNEYGNLVEMSAPGLTGLEPNEDYLLPVGGIYYIKDVTYDADKASGSPYWGPVLESSFEKQTFELKKGQTTKVTIWFDMFGGDYAIRVAFDPKGGSCAKSEMWFTKPRESTAYNGKYRVDKTLPKPEKSGCDFTGWFTAGGQLIQEGSSLSGDTTLYAHWAKMKEEWVYLFPDLAADYNGDIAAVAIKVAANGCRTVGDCYTLGINPEDPNDDFRITAFRMEGAKPIITVNHTVDGSGESLLPRMKTLGKAELSGEWEEVPEEGNPDHRFFTVTVEAP